MRLLICILLFSGWYNQGNTQSNIHPESEVKFKISNFGLNKVKGRFSNMSGEVLFDASRLDTSYFDVCIDANTIDTGKKKRDNHLKEEKYFYTEKHPQICFQSQRITAEKNGYLVTGLLTLKDTTKTVQIPFSFEKSTLKGKFSIKRKDFGIGPISGVTMGKTVHIEIICKIENE